jgi:hypothetical protein
MQGIAPSKMQKLIDLLKKMDEITEGIKLLNGMQKEIIHPDDFVLLSRFFIFPGQDVVMTDANCIKLKLFMAIGMMNQVFNARFKIILRGGFAVRMNILKAIQTDSAFVTTKSMNDLISTMANADLDCLVVPETGIELSTQDQSVIIRLLQMSIETTVERFKAKQLESSLSKRSEVSQSMNPDLQGRMNRISEQIAALGGEDEESQSRKIALNAQLQRLQASMKSLVAPVAPPYPVELEIKNAKNSALTTKMFWKPMKDTAIELIDVTFMEAHDPESLYADASRMKQIRLLSSNVQWYYPGQNILLMEYLNVIHAIGLQIQRISTDPTIKHADKQFELRKQQNMLTKFKSRSQICYQLLTESERTQLLGSLPPHLRAEVMIPSHKGGAKSRRSKHKKRVRRTKKRNSRKPRK